MTTIPASGRICGTCAFWGQDHDWSPSDQPDDVLQVHGWPGHCARKDQRTIARQTCAMWSPPAP